MPSKKRSQEKLHEESRKEEREEEYFLEEDDEEKEIISDPVEDDETEYVLAENAEEKIEEALALLGSEAPAIISSQTEPTYNPYPSEAHAKNRVKYTPGDITLPFNDTLILR
jgi:hypothetical protein